MKTFFLMLMICLTALFINHEQCTVKMFELELQMEIAKALGRATKPSLELRPGTDESGTQENRRDRL